MFELTSLGIASLVHLSFMAVALSTTDFIVGFSTVRHVDLVSGSCMRARNDIADKLSSIPQMFGGEVSSYSSLIEDTKNQALQKMVQKARTLNANAIIGISFQLINENKMSGVLVSGTAVWIEPQQAAMNVM